MLDGALDIDSILSKYTASEIIKFNEICKAANSNDTEKAEKLMNELTPSEDEKLDTYTSDMEIIENYKKGLAGQQQELSKRKAALQAELQEHEKAGEAIVHGYANKAKATHSSFNAAKTEPTNQNTNRRGCTLF